MHILPPYAALLALLFVALSVRTIRLRRSLRIAIGDSGDERMLRAMRVHANFVEYVPFGVLLLFLVETQGANPLLVHRLAHAYGVSQPRENFRYRVFGMALTFTTLLTSAGYLLFAFVAGR
jgi:uncharacterized membrane protein YecN with MAPEG domain